MPRIRVDIDVPDETSCRGCKMKHEIYDIDYGNIEKVVCLQFRDKYWFPKQLDSRRRRLPQCIAAEVKEHSEAPEGW